jgi:hypothetical protein
MRARAVLLPFAVTSTLLVVACGAFSGADTAGDPAVDSGNGDGAIGPSDGASGGDAGGPVGDASAALDGTAFSCALFPQAFFCADFDETPAVAYALGTPIGLTGLPDGSAIVKPGVSPPFAFWSSVSDYRVKGSGGNTVTYIHATFQIRFDSSNIGSGGFARLSVGPQQCNVNLKQEQGPDRIGIDTHCDYGGQPGSFYDHKDLLTPLPASGVWLPAELTLDLANATSSGRIGNATASMGLNPKAKPGGAPAVEFGPDFTANRIGIDDVIVDVR